MPKKLIDIASEIVQAQVSLTFMAATDIAASLQSEKQSGEEERTAREAPRVHWGEKAE